MATADGSLANVFVRVRGTFLNPVPTQPVTLDQKGCLFNRTTFPFAEFEECCPCELLVVGLLFFLVLEIG